MPITRAHVEQFVRFEASANVADSLTVCGYSLAQIMVAVLKASGDNLTRENVTKQAASIHNLTQPMLLPGITLSTSADDFAPIKQMPWRSSAARPGTYSAR